MLIRPSQIRAARALLDWTIHDLAKRAGVGASTISAIETGRSDGSLEVLKNIFFAFTVSGVELTPEGGVIPAEGKIVTLYGTEGFRAFMDDVYELSRTVGGEICIFNVSPSLLTKWLGAEWYKAHAKRMLEIKNKIEVKVLVHKGEQNFIGKSFAEYRTCPMEGFNDRTIYTYGYKTGFLYFNEDSIKITVMDQPEITKNFNTLFNIAWNNLAQKIAINDE